MAERDIEIKVTNHATGESREFRIAPLTLRLAVRALRAARRVPAYLADNLDFRA